MAKKNKNKINEIKWNIVNSALAGCLVLLGGLADGNLSFENFCYALIAGLLVAVTKFRDYWNRSNGKMFNMFNFI